MVFITSWKNTGGSVFYRFIWLTVFSFSSLTQQRARVAQWWEHSPPTNVARVQIPASTPYVGWVCCWFSPLLREVFLRVLRCSLSSKTKTFKLQFNLERTDTFKRVFLSASWVKKQVTIFFIFFFTAAAIQDDNGSDQSKSLMNFLRHFNQNRHHVANPEGKQKARDFIKKTFKDLGLITWSEPFKPDFPQVRFKLSFYWIRIDGNDDFCV